jgi:zinc and cadmium transporter
MSAPVVIALYSLLIVAASLLGGWLPQAFRMSHTRLQTMISLVAGFMLGVSLFHMLPHGVGLGGSLDDAMLWTVAGLLVMFFLMRAFHFHDHGHAEGECDAGEEHERGHVHARPPTHRLGWVGVAIGFGIHSAIDGVAVAASVVAEEGGTLPGVGTLLAVMLHKPLDALAVTSTMAAAGWTSRSRTIANLVFALTCPLGAVLFYAGSGAEPGPAVGWALAFSAGVFLCIALADLLPEIQFHAHDRLRLSAALLIGIALAWAIRFVEPGHGHDHGADPHAGHDHSGHDH